MTKALVLGKFLPLHKGHEYLIDYAIKNSDKLYIIVDNIYDEIIPLDTRMNWIKELYPNAIALIQSEFSLADLTTVTCQQYKLYGAQIVTGTSEEQEQANFISKFLDIYENSYFEQ